MNLNDITVVIATSVLPSHPDTSIIDETVFTIRKHLPDSEIIMQVDGLRPERLERKQDFDEYKNRILWKCLHEWTNVVPVIFDDFNHQTNMMKKTIDLIKTPLMLYVEGDAPLTPDEPIDWEKCISFIESGEANTIRFHFESQIPEPHKHLMMKKKGDFLQTAQWSQRPHLTTVFYYKDVVLPNAEEQNFIEDKFYGTVVEDYKIHKLIGWRKHRLWIYHPGGGNIKRSYHLDGRAGTRKFTSDDDIWGYKE
jgi:hypothetical protein